MPVSSRFVISQTRCVGVGFEESYRGTGVSPKTLPVGLIRVGYSVTVLLHMEAMKKNRVGNTERGWRVAWKTSAYRERGFR